MQEEAPTPLPCADMTSELQLVSVRCELAAFEAAAAGGPVPAELLNPGGRKLKAAYLKKLAAQEVTLRGDIDADSAATLAVSSPRFRALVISLAKQEVCSAREQF